MFLLDRNYVEVVPYGTEFDSIQKVFDFLISYGRYLEKEGWVFGLCSVNVVSEALRITQKEIPDKCTHDVSVFNFMQRKNGTLVLIDPWAEKCFNFSM